jgi:Collagen triple helix repeat (20 copies)
MFSTIRKRITYTNVAMTLALVFAMSGGAYAASKYLITSTKQISPKVLKQLKGKNGTNGKAGASGPAGSQGPVGPAGKDGVNGIGGANGTNGTDGASVTNKALTAADAACNKEGGSEFTAAESKKTTACNGSPWTVGGLPKGATETGEWTISQFVNEGGGEEIAAASISFNVPLAAALAVSKVHLIEPGVIKAATGKGTLTSGSKTVTSLTTTTGSFAVGSSISGTGIPASTTITACSPSCGVSATSLTLSANATASGTNVSLTAPGAPAGCTGNYAEPGAESGHLCVFAKRLAKFVAFLAPISTAEGTAGADRSGAQLLFGPESIGEFFANGTWAVTG